MRLSGKQFMASSHKTITLLGMSGVGKTRLASHLPTDRWFHYSADYRIGTKYLQEPILDNIKKQAMAVPFLRDLLRSDSIYIGSNISTTNLQPISTFLGKIGNPDLGGLAPAEFKHRQRLHKQAEIGSMYDVAAFIEKAHKIYGYEHFVNDTSGSLCELPDTSTVEALAKNTLIIYIKADKEMEQELLKRALAKPKPLYYQETFLDEKLAAYMRAKKLEYVNDIVPDEFVQWIFPHLLEHRKPLYEAIAKQHGYIINANDVLNIHSEDDFNQLICSVLD